MHLIYYLILFLIQFIIRHRPPPPSLFLTHPPHPPHHHPPPTQQVSEFLFGEGFAITGGDQWRVRRKAVGPALHRGYLEAMLARVFCPCSERLADALDAAAATGAPVDMEARLCVLWWCCWALIYLVLLIYLLF